MNSDTTPVQPVTGTEQTTPTQPGNGTSQSPLITPAAPKPLTPEQQAKNKKGAVGGIIAVIVMIAVLIAANIISKSIAQKALDYVVDVCETHGLYSTQCKDAQKEKKVDCDITGCTKNYTTFF